jgi:ArsR family transcriptional regulator
MFEEWADRFRVLGDATRLRILRLLSVRDACVCELVALLPVSQPAVSQHLRRLKQAGLVTEYRHKAWTFYRLRPDIPAPVAACLAILRVDDQEAAWLRGHRVDVACDTLTGPAAGGTGGPAAPLGGAGTGLGR